MRQSPPGAPRHELAQSDPVAVFLAALGPRTQRVYAGALRRFAAWRGDADAAAAARRLLAEGPGRANATAHHWRADMLNAGLAPATVNVELAALRSLVRMARIAGAIPWRLECPGVRVNKRARDTRGPGRAAVLAMLDVAQTGREELVLRLLHDVGLRRAEVCDLDLGHYDAARGTLAVLGKGRHQREPLRLPGPTLAALERYLLERGDEPGPLVLSPTGRRLTGESVRLLVRTMGERAGVGVVRPHGLRHTAITYVAQKTGDMAAAQAFARHNSPTTTAIYFDHTHELQAQAAEIVAGGERHAD